MANGSLRPVGYKWLIDEFKLNVPALQLESYVRTSSRLQAIPNRVYYPANQEPKDVAGHLNFALKNETINLLIWHELAKVMPAQVIEDWVTKSPTSAYARRAWMLFELVGEQATSLPDLKGSIPYAPLLDAEKYVTSAGVKRERYKVEDNTIGTGHIRVIVQQSEKIGPTRTATLQNRIREIQSAYTTDDVIRAVNYLYKKETKSSFEIEREQVSNQKMSRFVHALRQAESVDIQSEKGLLDLQSIILDEGNRDSGFRTEQNFVGETWRGREQVHYICPQPQDVRQLMQSWFDLQNEVAGLDPIIATAVLAFIFVYIHPFNDGNGRIHRFVLHKWLAASGFVPKEVVIPVSAAIVRNEKDYDAALEQLSKPIVALIEYTLEGQDLRVSGDTDHLYRLIDLTHQVEFIYDSIEESIRNDFVEELDIIIKFDEVAKLTDEFLDIPKKDQSLLLELIVQPPVQGQLAKRERDRFPAVSDQDLQRVEAIVQRVWSSTNNALLAKADPAETRTIEELTQELANLKTQEEDAGQTQASLYYQRGLLYQQQFAYSESLQDFTEAINICQAAKEDHDGDFHYALAEALLHRSVARMQLGGFDDAIQDAGSAIVLFENFENPKGVFSVWSLRLQTIRAYCTRGTAYRLAGNNRQAVADHEKANNEITAMIEVPVKELAPEFHEVRAQVMFERAATLMQSESYALAELSYSEGIKALQSCLLAPTPLQSPNLPIRLGVAYLNLGFSQYSQRERDEAVTSFGNALKSLPISDHESHGYVMVALNRSKALLWRGVCHRLGRNYGEALKDLNEAALVQNNLRERLEPSSRWSRGMREQLASTYTERSYVFEKTEETDQAAQDREAAKTLMEPTSRELQR